MALHREGEGASQVQRPAGRGRSVACRLFGGSRSAKPRRAPQHWHQLSLLREQALSTGQAPLAEMPWLWKTRGISLAVLSRLEAVELTLKLGFVCPFVVIDLTDLGATLVVAQALRFTIFNYLEIREPYDARGCYHHHPPWQLLRRSRAPVPPHMYAVDGPRRPGLPRLAGSLARHWRAAQPTSPGELEGRAGGLRRPGLAGSRGRSGRGAPKRGAPGGVAGR